MKKILFLIFLTAHIVYGAEPPFNHGVNLSKWFEVQSPEQIQFTEFTRQDFVNIKSLGCDVIRLPINLHFMAEGAPDYTVSPLFLSYLDQVLDWAEELEIYLIIDNHTFNWAADTDPNIGETLIPVWIQLAERYNDRSDYILYEVLNEPHGISDEDWSAIQQDAIAAIRSKDATHTIIVGGAGWNGFYDLPTLPEYNDANLIYTFHFYEPYLFTLQGAEVISPSLATLTGVPFPYDASQMPEIPPVLLGTWVGDEINTHYQYNGTVEHMHELLDIAIDFKNTRNVPVYCGEFGSTALASTNEDRTYWCETIRRYLEENGIPWTMWEYEELGFFENENEQFDYDLNIPMLSALGLNTPPQSEFVFKPDTTGFDIFTDDFGAGFFEASWIDNGRISYHDSDHPAVGSTCIYWAQPNQYNRIDFKIRPLKDITWLKDHGYVLDFWVRTDAPGAQFSIFFLDSETSVADHPWRMTTTIDDPGSGWTAEWHHVQIPLADFVEGGAWDNDTWYDPAPAGNFDWTQVSHFQIVAELKSLTDWQLWFDNIRIVAPDDEPPLPISSHNFAYMKPVTASQSLNENPPDYAVDGNRDTFWGAGSHPTQWIEVDLQTPVDIQRINLITSQYPDGFTAHTVWGLPSGGQYIKLHEFNGITGDDQELTVMPSSPWLAIKRIRIETTQSPSWVSWREIEVFGISVDDEFIQVSDDNWHFETSESHRAFLPFGVNYYDPGTYHPEPYLAFDVIGAFDSTDVDRQLGKIQDLRANIVRIFLSVVRFEPDLFMLNEASFQKLDKLISIAKRQHLRIIFDLVNDWEGNPAWESWEYYAEETTLQGYEFYLEALGTRYADEPTIFSWSLKNEPYVRGPGSGIMGDLWKPYARFKYGSEANLAAAWSDYPRAGETWDEIKQPDGIELDVLENPGNQRLYDYQLFREDIAYNWVRRLSAALRRTDPNHMITVGLDQHSVPIMNAVPERTYTAFNPIKIAPLIDYVSIHAYNWWDVHTVNTFIKAIARYSYTNKPVLVEEFNLKETGATILPLMDSSVGWLHWAAYDVPGSSDGDNLFDASETITALGNSFRGLTDWAYLATPVRSTDVTWVDIDLEQALTSVDYQNTRFAAYVSTFNSTGGPVGFNVLNYRGPLRLGMPAIELPEHLAIGDDLEIGWSTLNWPIMPEVPVSLLLSRDGGDQWETIADNVKDDKFSWKVTGPVSDQCVLRIVDNTDENIYIDSPTEFVISNTTAVDQTNASPLTFELYSAYPNPFNPSTIISYQLPVSSDVHLSVYNLNGQLVQTLVTGQQEAGLHQVEWNGMDDWGQTISSGVYLYRLQAGNRVSTSKMLLMK
ncbi:cellulase family glycosylhydrolase [candidate division KSB1 bacterium]|nr:cellulase family glycosylhydrolase [candidate division KSB1 bacterium]